MSQHAKSLLFSIVFLATALADSLAGENKQIQEVELDEHSICTVPVSFSRVTTKIGRASCRERV